MAKSVQKITLSPSRDIPFDKLVLSQSNVRHVKAGVSIEELAEDIAPRGLLMGLSVRAIVDKAGVETGIFEIPAGGRRYRALAALIGQRRLAKGAEPSTVEDPRRTAVNRPWRKTTRWPKICWSRTAPTRSRPNNMAPVNLVPSATTGLFLGRLPC